MLFLINKVKKYSIEFEQFINLPIQDVFLFFSQPKNLSLITPPRLKFNILTPEPIHMNEGQLIDYSLTIMYFIQLRWRTLITDYDKPNKFIDHALKNNKIPMYRLVCKLFLLGFKKLSLIIIFL